MTDQTSPTPPSGAPRPRSDHFVNKEPWDPYVAERLTADQEKYYMAGQWKLMWWRFRRHRPAVVSAVFLAFDIFLHGHQRVHRALRPAHAALGLHLCAAAAGPCHARGPVPRSVRLCAQDHARHGDLAARLHARHDQAAEAALLLPGRLLRVLGPDRGQLPSCLPAGGRQVLLAGHRPARPRHVQPHRLCRAHLAHHRHHRHCALLRARPGPGRARRLLRRLGRQRRPAHHRDHQELPAPAAVAGAVGGAARHLVAAAGLFRHHHHPRPARLAGAGARRALQAPVACARRTTPPPPR